MLSRSLSLLVACASVAAAMPKYAALIPNGKGVAGVTALGHTDPANGGDTNAFGDAFAKAGRSWTVALCKADSDGDGQTNGEELGDPCCVWKVGDSPAVPSGAKDPGSATSKLDDATLAASRAKCSPTPAATPTPPAASPSAKPATPAAATPSTTTATTKPATTTTAPSATTANTTTKPTATTATPGAGTVKPADTNATPSLTPSTSSTSGSATGTGSSPPASSGSDDDYTWVPLDEVKMTQEDTNSSSSAASTVGNNSTTTKKSSATRPQTGTLVCSLMATAVLGLLSIVV